MIISNWIEKEEQENLTELLCNFEEYGGVMDRYLFKGKTDTEIHANNYPQACVKLVDRLVKGNKLILDDLNGYVFIELFGDPNEIVTDCKEKHHACAKYVKTLTDRGILSYAGGWNGKSRRSKE